MPRFGSFPSDHVTDAERALDEAEGHLVDMKKSKQCARKLTSLVKAAYACGAAGASRKGFEYDERSIDPRISACQRDVFRALRRVHRVCGGGSGASKRRRR